MNSPLPVHCTPAPPRGIPSVSPTTDSEFPVLTFRIRYVSDPGETLDDIIPPLLLPIIAFDTDSEGEDEPADFPSSLDYLAEQYAHSMVASVLAELEDLPILSERSSAMSQQKPNKVDRLRQAVREASASVSISAKIEQAFSFLPAVSVCGQKVASPPQCTISTQLCNVTFLSPAGELCNRRCKVSLVAETVANPCANVPVAVLDTTPTQIVSTTGSVPICDHLTAEQSSFLVGEESQDAITLVAHVSSPGPDLAHTSMAPCRMVKNLRVSKRENHRALNVSATGLPAVNASKARAEGRYSRVGAGKRTASYHVSNQSQLAVEKRPANSRVAANPGCRPHQGEAVSKAKDGKSGGNNRSYEQRCGQKKRRSRKSLNRTFVPADRSQPSPYAIPLIHLPHRARRKPRQLAISMDCGKVPEEEETEYDPLCEDARPAAGQHRVQVPASRPTRSTVIFNSRRSKLSSSSTNSSNHPPSKGRAPAESAEYVPEEFEEDMVEDETRRGQKPRSKQPVGKDWTECELFKRVMMGELDAGETMAEGVMKEIETYAGKNVECTAKAENLLTMLCDDLCLRPADSSVF